MIGRQNIVVKNKIAVLLLTIFMLPIAYNTVYIVFNHYQEYVCTAKNENHFHIEHKSNSKYLFTYIPVIILVNCSKFVYNDFSIPLYSGLLSNYKFLPFQSLSPRAPPLS